MIKTAGLRKRLNRLHHFHGYHGELRYIVWAVMVDVTALAMIFFAISGVLLWYKLNRKRTLGWTLLVGTALLTAATIATYV